MYEPFPENKAFLIKVSPCFPPSANNCLFQNKYNLRTKYIFKLIIFEIHYVEMI